MKNYTRADLLEAYKCLTEMTDLIEGQVELIQRMVANNSSLLIVIKELFQKEQDDEFKEILAGVFLNNHPDVDMIQYLQNVRGWDDDDFFELKGYEEWKKLNP